MSPSVPQQETVADCQASGLGRAPWVCRQAEGEGQEDKAGPHCQQVGQQAFSFSSY